MAAAPGPGRGLDVPRQAEQQPNSEMNLGHAVNDERNVLDPAHPVLSVDDMHHLRSTTQRSGRSKYMRTKSRTLPSQPVYLSAYESETRRLIDSWRRDQGGASTSARRLIDSWRTKGITREHLCVNHCFGFHVSSE